MHIRWRRLYYFLVSVVFLILAPLLVFYAMGWRYNWTTGQLSPTGVLNISSQPERARIFIDDRLIGERTPAVVSNIVAGRHKITLDKEGYQLWYKWLDVRPKMAAFTDEVILFPENPSSQVVLPQALPLLAWWPSGDSALMVTQQGEIFWVDDVSAVRSSADLLSLGLLASSAISPDWQVVFSPFGKKAALYSESKMVIVDVDKRSVEERTLEGVFLSRVMWWQNNDLLYLDKKTETVWRYTLTDQKNQERFSRDSLDFFADQGQLFLLKKSAQEKISLHSWNNGQERFIADLVSSDGYRFEGIFSDVLTILDPGERLYFLESKGENWVLEEIQDDILWLEWLSDSRKFLFGNEWELHYYDYPEDYQEVFLRSGEKISEVLWHPSGRVVFLVINDHLRAREMDQRDRVNTAVLWNHVVRDMFVDDKGEFMFFVDSEDGYLKRLGL